MYSLTADKQSTLFRFTLPQARSVALIGDVVGQCWRLPLERIEDVWETVVDLPGGWFFYAIEVDGNITWDRDVGKMKTNTGQRCSLACIAR